MGSLLVLLEHLLVLPIVTKRSGNLGKEEFSFVTALFGCCSQLLPGYGLQVIFRILINTVKTEGTVTYLLGIDILVIVLGVFCVEKRSLVAIQEHIE